ncbi:two-component system, OmpR family, sensor histidine kinase BaeS [Massilia sp. CF038]|nr:two-component system, OmpR family, sensor histidine kinase BaeS [Massilia sp. CF038]
MLAVAATALVLMRQNVMRSFAEYAVSIELDRLDELSNSLARRYQTRGGWQFVPAEREARAEWIAIELARLQRQRQLGVAVPEAPAAPAPPAPPAPPVAIREPLGRAVAPEPPAPPAPPLPPPFIPEPPDEPSVLPPVDELGLQDRVTLLGADGRYLAGYSGSAGTDARRAIISGGKTVGYLAVARGARPSDAMARTFVQQMKDSLPIIIGASLALSALAAMLLAAHFRKPILRLAEGARDLADGHYERRLPDARSDELGDLAATFNQLADKLGRAETSRRQWVADTSHELRTPLSVLRAQLEAVQDGVRPANADSTAAMLRQVLSLNKLIDELYALARADVGELALQRHQIDLWQLATEQASAFSDKFSAAGLAFHAVPPTEASTVLADSERLRQVFANLFENCIRYCGAGARIAMQLNTEGGVVKLTIDDSGPGVSEAALARLGERFFRVEGSRSREHGGAGLGLALVQRIMQAHGGTLTFARSPMGGLQVRLAMPMVVT